MREALEAKNVSEYKLQSQLREANRKHVELESRVKEDMMMARIRDAESTQCMAELTQKISSLEFKVRLFRLLHSCIIYIHKLTLSFILIL